MLDTLLAAETKGLIDSEGVREEVDTFTFEGHGTTGSGLIFTLLLLAHHPEAQEKILLEVKEIQGEKNGSQKFTVNDLNNMKYLDCVIKESLRLYPPVPYLARTLTEDLELGLYIEIKN
jgi:cytochrome P450 family 4